MAMKKLLLTGLLILGVVGLAGCRVERDMVGLTIHIQGEGLVHSSGDSRILQGTLVELKALPDVGWEFSRWQGPVADPFSAETTILIDKKKVAKAIFMPSGKPHILEAPGGLMTWRPERSRGEADIEYIMLHAISDAATNPRNPYDMKRIRAIFDSYGVESHYVIDRTGTIYHFVPDDHVARHAGVGSWNNDPKLTNTMNHHAIGIELLGIGTRAEMKSVIGTLANTRINSSDRGYTEEQYVALAHLLHYLTGLYGIPRENIINHSDYDPGRKWDPGELFDRQKIGF